MQYSKKVGECLEWCVENRKTSFGYGFINFRSSQIMTHRAAWLVWKGKVPNNMWVLHKCDNPACINPDHLFLGDHKKNMDDMRSKNRMNNQKKASNGEKNGSAKLTREKVSQIKFLRKQGLSGPKKAKMFGVTHAIVYKICSNKLWKEKV